MAGLNSDTKLLLHCDGTDGSTTFTDSRLTNPHTITAVGTAQIDTAYKKWGSASGLFDGNSDYLTIPDSSDWDLVASNSDDWTIDGWVYLNSLGANQIVISQLEDGDNGWFLRINSSNQLQFYSQTGGTAFLNLFGGSISSSVWVFITLCKVGNEYGLYVNGVQVAYELENSTDTYACSLGVGRHSSISTQYFNGHLDEVRVQKSNYFNASPNSGKTDTITAPTEAYSVVASGVYVPNQTIIIM